MINWRQNLGVIWASQFFSIMGFAFALPFHAFYMQKDLGVTDPEQLKIWMAAFGAAAPLSLAIFSPLWGIVADRYGRRPMMLRANLGAALMLVCMGAVTSVGQLVFLRGLQGVLTGTMTAAQTMVAVQAPRKHTGMAMGTLGSAVFLGAMVGAGTGGFVADALGYRAAFFVSGGLLVISALLVVFGTREEFTREAARTSEEKQAAKRDALRHMGLVIPVLGLMVGIAFVRRFDITYFPLLVQEINEGSVAGAASWLGCIAALAGFGGFLSCIVLGHLADRVAPERIGKWSSFLTGLLMIPQALAQGFLLLFGLRFGMALCFAGVEPVCQAWVAREVPQRMHGVLFGWSATARSIGWLLSPVISGAIAVVWGIRTVFYVAAFCYFAFVVLIAVASRRMDSAAEESVPS